MKAKKRRLSEKEMRLKDLSGESKSPIPFSDTFSRHRQDRMTTLQLRGEHITLAQAVKAAGLADTGGQAKYLVREGRVAVNGSVERQPGRKLHAGDRFGLEGGDQWTISR